MDALCSIQSHIASFNDIVHLWTINLVLYLDIHIKIRDPPDIDHICGFVLILLCGLLSVSDGTDNSLLLQTKVSLSSFCLKQILPLIQLLLRQ